MQQVTHRFIGLIAASLLAVPMIACASQPPSELIEARATYDDVSRGIAAEMAPAELHDAQKALSSAEKAYQDEGDAWVTRTMAYIAKRKAETAKVIAETRQQEREIVSYEKEHEAIEERLRTDQARELGQKDKQLEDTRGELAVERGARVQAEVDASQARAQAAEAKARYDRALARLGEIARMNEEERGLVISLSSGVIFATGQSNLRAPGQEKLGRVVEVLNEQPERRVEIEGHTDAEGADGFNMQLSRERAEQVRSYLIQRGVDASRITAVGYGETRPIADNDTVEGRANNRRVEIVLKPLPASID